MNTILRWLVLFFILLSISPRPVGAQGLPDSAPADDIKGGSPAGPSWTLERIDDRHFFSQSSPGKDYLKIDSSGNPHIVYGGDHLYHAWWNLGIWHTEVVDSALNVGRYASLAIDGQNKLHIAYYDAANQDLKYATNRFGAWHIQTIVSSGNAGAGTAIGVDNVQDPYFVYRDGSSGQLWVAYLTNGNMEEPPDLISGSFFTSDFWMASLGPANIQVIFYTLVESGKALEGRLYYTSNQQTTDWTPDLVDYGGIDTGESADIALDSSGNPHVIYGYSEGELNISRYSKSTDFGINWTSPFGQPIDVFLPESLALALNAANQPIVAMQSGGKLYKYTWSGTAWVDELVESGSQTGFFPTVALYPVGTSNAGQPAFAYLDDPGSKVIHLNYREIYNGNWWPVDGPALLDQSQKVGACSTSLTGPDGNPWVVYSADTTHRLFFKRFYNGAWEAPREIGSELGGVINCAHAAAVGGGKAGVIFTTESADLLYTTITCSGTSCVIPAASVIQNGIGAPLSFIDLTLDANGYAHMVYLSSGNPKQMLYFYESSSGSGLSFGPAAATDYIFSGSDRPVSIKRTSGGTIQIAYELMGLNDSVFYVRYSRGVWGTPQSWTVNGQDAYNGLSLSLDSSGDPAIAYTYIYNPSQLLLLTGDCASLPCSWPAPTLVDSFAESSVYQLPSLVTDAQDHYRLSYIHFDNGIRYLQYVRINGAQKEFRPVDQYSGLGNMTSLALAPNGAGRISYADLTNGDLLFAWQNVQVFLPVIRK